MNGNQNVIDASSLERWLAVATKGLCDEARERIAEEMFRHVMERARDLQVEGQSPDEAFDEAFRGLGSARVARRGFRRTQLTEREFRYMKTLTTRLPPKKLRDSTLLHIYFIGACQLFLTTVCLWGILAKGIWPGWVLGTQFQLLVLGIAAWLFWVRSASRGDGYCAVAGNAGFYLAMLLFWIPNWSHVDRFDNSSFHAMLLGIYLAFGFGLYRSIRLLRKLHRVPPNRIRFQ